MGKKTVISVQVKDVEKRRQPSKHYVYVIYVTWSGGEVCVIYRRYSKFFDFQSRLLDQFPLEAGEIDPTTRTIPFLPGKILFGRSHIRDVALRRLKPIDNYCQALVRLPTHISECDLVQNFFEVTSSDVNPNVKKSSSRKQSAENISEPLVLETHIAIADYEKEQKNEVTLREGMQVDVVEKHESGWWFVNVDEEQGWVPSSYLDLPYGGMDVAVNRAVAGKEEKYVCTRYYEKQQRDEVTVPRGHLVDVVETNLTGWWLIKYEGKEGMFPAAYLSKAAPSTVKRMENASATYPVEMVPSARAVSDILPASHQEPSTSRSSGTTHQTAPAKPVKKSPIFEKHAPPRSNSIQRNTKTPTSEYSYEKPSYWAAADLTMTTGDCLSLKKGQRVQVMDKGPSGWWFVCVEGEQGWAPASYIESREPSRIHRANDTNPLESAKGTSGRIGFNCPSESTKKAPEKSNQKPNRPPLPKLQGKSMGPVSAQTSDTRPVVSKPVQKPTPVQRKTVGVCSEPNTESDSDDDKLDYENITESGAPLRPLKPPSSQRERSGKDHPKPALSKKPNVKSRENIQNYKEADSGPEQLRHHGCSQTTVMENIPQTNARLPQKSTTQPQTSHLGHSQKTVTENTQKANAGLTQKSTMQPTQELNVSHSPNVAAKTTDQLQTRPARPPVPSKIQQQFSGDSHKSTSFSTQESIHSRTQQSAVNRTTETSYKPNSHGTSGPHDVNKTGASSAQNLIRLFNSGKASQSSD